MWQQHQTLNLLLGCVGCHSGQVTSHDLVEGHLRCRASLQDTGTVDSQGAVTARDSLACQTWRLCPGRDALGSI